MSEKKVNMFQKASEDRRQIIADQNIDVADEILSTKAEFKEKETESDIADILSRPKRAKKQCSFYLDAHVDDFFAGFCEATGVSKSKVVNQSLISVVLNDSEIQNRVNKDPKIKQLFEEFIKQN